MQNNNDFSMRRLTVSTAIYLVALLFILLVSSTTPFGISLATDDAQAVQTVRVQTAKHQQNYTNKRFFMGQVEANKTTMTGFELGGLLNRVHFDEGDTVNKGDLLATLDIQRLLARKQEAEAQLMNARSDAALAESTLARVTQARDANAVSAQEKDEAQEIKDASAAALAVAEAQLNRIVVDIDKANVVAPFDGTIIERHVDEGTVVSAGQSILVIQQSDPLKVRIGLTDQLAADLVVGQQRQISIKNQPHKATVKSIIPLRSKQRTVEVILNVDQPSVVVFPGETVRMSIDHDINQTGFWVANSGLIEGKRGLWSVYVVSNGANKPTAQRRTVLVHTTDNERSFVSGAVKDGEQVVTEGAKKLVPNQPIQLLSNNNEPS